MKKTNLTLQQELDVKKWSASEEKGTDMCGHMPYCGYCKIKEEYPCAKAYNRMIKEQNALLRPVAKAKPLRQKFTSETCDVNSPSVCPPKPRSVRNMKNDK